MFARESLALVAGLVLFSAIDVFQPAEAHPGCLGDVSLSDNLEASFCPTNADPLYAAEGFCCDAAQEAEIILQLSASNATGRCAKMQQEVLCTACHPYSIHLYERLGTGLTMTNEYCNEFYEECSGPDQLNLDEGYCGVHAGVGEDEYWSYPLVVNDTFTGEAVEAFPGIDINADIDKPVDMRMTPDGTKWWIVDMAGKIMEVDVSDPASQPSSMKLVLDLSDGILLDTEEGFFSVAFSPGFHTAGVFFLSYTPTKRDGSERGFNRLSRFQYFPSSADDTRLSEEVVLETSDKYYRFHSAGWIGFKPSAYADPSAGTFHDLYWSIGDSGNQFDRSQQGQNPDTLHGSIVRISVNSNMGADYQIPDGNPFKNGGGRPEICAQGFRNPWRCSFDRANDELWCGDVGQLEVESIKTIECGNNYGWRQFEGHRCVAEIQDGERQANSDIDGQPDIPYEFPTGCDDPSSREPYTFPEFSYCHPDYNYEDEGGTSILPEIPNDDFCGDKTIYGSAVIGGFVYRGQKYADLLGGNYIFADYTDRRLYHLYPEENGWGTEDGNKWGYGVVMGENFPRTVAFAEGNDGELYVLEGGKSIWELPCGQLCDGVPDDQVDAPTPPPVSLLPTPAPVPLADSTLEPVGCYRDGEPRFMGERVAFSDTEMTTEVCSAFCLESEYVGTQNGKECYCGDAPTDLDIYCNNTSCSNAKCTMACTGDSTQTCGGPWAMSVYRRVPTSSPTATPAPTGSAALTSSPTAAPAPAGSATPPSSPTAAPTPGYPDCNVANSDYIGDGWCDDLGAGYNTEECGWDGGDCCECECVASQEDRAWPCGMEADYACKDPSSCGSAAPASSPTANPTPGPTSSPTAALTPGTIYYAELGCAADPNPPPDPGRVMPVGPIRGDVMSAEICNDICQDQLPGFEYFGTQWGAECFCAMTLPENASFDPGYDGCVDACAGNPEEICGGSDAITVYQADSDTDDDSDTGDYKQLGCAADPKASRVLSVGPIPEDAMSAEICLGICQDRLPGFVYFGTQFGVECFCAMKLRDGVSFDPEYDGCIAACAGSTDGEICGGTDAITVYSVVDPQ